MNICIYKHNPTVDVTLRILEAYERAFKRQGHDVLILSQEMENYSAEQAREFAQKFLNFEADLAICYGFSAMPRIAGGYFFRKHDIPLVIFCFENPFFGLNANLVNEIRSYQGHYYFFVWDSYYLDLLRQLFENCYPIRHAVELGEVSAPSSSGDVLFERELAFVGNIPNFFHMRSERMKNDDPPEHLINGLLELIISKKIHHMDFNIIALTRDYLKNKMNNDQNDLMFSLTDSFFHQEIFYPLYAEGLGLYRYYLLNQLDMFHIHYYGDVNWKSSHIAFHPPIDYFSDVPRVYRSTLINLDIPAFQSITSVNNRFFDVAGAGSMLLTEYKSDLKSIFADFDSVTYTSLADLKEKIGFYLQNIGVRNQVAEKLHRCVSQNHTYEHRVHYLLETLES